MQSGMSTRCCTRLKTAMLGCTTQTNQTISKFWDCYPLLSAQQSVPNTGKPPALRIPASSPILDQRKHNAGLLLFVLYTCLTFFSCRRLALEFHPDRAKGQATKACAEALFTIISDAYATLTGKPVADEDDCEGDGDMGPSEKHSSTLSSFCSMLVHMLKRKAYVFITMSPL